MQLQNEMTISADKAPQITSPQSAFNFFKSRLVADVEEFWVAALNSKKDVIEAACIFRGTVDCCPVHPRDIFRFACLHNASSIILGHNHPCGTVVPSVEDHAITKQLLKAAAILQVPIVDHLIVAGERYFSFSMKGLIPSLQISNVAHSEINQWGEK